jgi:hypothetical protein
LPSSGPNTTRSRRRGRSRTASPCSGIIARHGLPPTGGRGLCSAPAAPTLRAPSAGCLADTPSEVIHDLAKPALKAGRSQLDSRTCPPRSFAGAGRKANDLWKSGEPGHPPAAAQLRTATRARGTVTARAKWGKRLAGMGTATEKTGKRPLKTGTARAKTLTRLVKTLTRFPQTGTAETETVTGLQQRCTARVKRLPVCGGRVPLGRKGVPGSAGNIPLTPGAYPFSETGYASEAVGHRAFHGVDPLGLSGGATYSRTRFSQPNHTNQHQHQYHQWPLR